MTNDFMARVLTELGLPVNAWTLEFMAEWARFEGTSAQHNPLATTKTMPGSTNFNSAGVQNFATPGDGVRATAMTLDPLRYNPSWIDYYRAIRQALNSSQLLNRNAVVNELRRWGTTGFAARIENGWTPLMELKFTAMPCAGPITGRFGQIEGYDSPHRGVDIGCPVGTPIYYTGNVPAKAVAFTNDGSFGLGACIDAINTPWYVLTAHMSVIEVALGQDVQPGQRIGLSGNTGKSTGPHCHWQVCRSSTFPTDINQSTDPLLMMAEPVPAPPPQPTPDEYDVLFNSVWQERAKLMRLGWAADHNEVLRAVKALETAGFKL